MAIENVLKAIEVLDQATDEIASLIRSKKLKMSSAVKYRLDQTQQLLLNLMHDLEAKEIHAPLFNR